VVIVCGGASRRFSCRSAAALLCWKNRIMAIFDGRGTWHQLYGVLHPCSSPSPFSLNERKNFQTTSNCCCCAFSFWGFGSVILGGFSTYGVAKIFTIPKTFSKVHSQVQLWLQCMTRLLSEPWNGRHELFNLLTRSHRLSCHLNYRIWTKIFFALILLWFLQVRFTFSKPFYGCLHPFWDDRHANQPFSLKNDPVALYTSITVLFPVGTCKPC